MDSHGKSLREHTESASFLDALNSHDPEKLRTVLAPDFHFEEVAGPGEESIRALLEEFAMVFSAFPDILFRATRHSREETRLYVEFRAMGTHIGEFLSVPATGTTVVVSGVFNIEADSEGLRRLRMTVDFGGLRRQLLLASRRQERR